MTGRSSGDKTTGKVNIRAVKSGEVEEIHAMTVPVDALVDAAAQTRRMYQAILEDIGDVAGLHLVVERVFGDLSTKETFLSARAEVLTGAGLDADGPVTFLECKPVDGNAMAGAQLTFVRTGSDVITSPIFDGDRRCGTSVNDGNVERAYLACMHGMGSSEDPGDAVTQARRMFERTLTALTSVGLGYRSVVCTRIYLRRLLEWYDVFNSVRTPFYAELGLGPTDDERSVPPSTGIQGTIAEACECVMDVTVVRHADGRACPFEKLHNPLQNEATDYGSAFARGGVVEVAGAKHVIISGTASIDETGKSVHIDDPEGQTRRTIENFEAILAAGGAKPADLYHATWYCQKAEYAAAVRDVMKGRGWPDLPYVIVVADVCRRDLLVEVDGTALIIT